MHTRRLGQGGFTLIELMTVVVVIGLLVALALPTMNEFLIRARVTEALTLGERAKVAVGESFSQRGAFPNSNAEAGLPAGSAMSGSSVASVEVDPGGVIVLTLAATIGGTPSMDSREIFLTPSTVAGGSITWVCDIAADSTRFKYVPPECRR